uniref:type I polyketide synthase n=1 Tax=Streptomyces zagrosensis TaxID=1042984 RepID=UPI0035E45A6F
MSLAAVNGPLSVVVSGDVVALRELVAECEADGVRARVIAVDYASHSAQVEEIRDRLLEELAPVQPQSASVPVYSSVTGGLLDAGAADAAYWVRNLRETVRFEEAVQALLADGRQVFVEVSPHPVLTTSLQEILDASAASAGIKGVVVGTLRRGEGGSRRMVASLAELFVHGVPVSWSSLFAGLDARRVELPTYAFQRERYWPDAPASVGDVVGAGLATPGHPLLGAMVELPESGGMLFTGKISVRTHPWLADHVVRGHVVFPPTALVDLAVRAGDAVGCDHLGDLELTSPLVLPDHGGCQLRVSLTEREEGWTVSVHARPDGGANWTRHATGLLTTRTATDSDFAGLEAAATWPPSGATEIDLSSFYAVSDTDTPGTGIAHGPVFQGLTRAWTQGDRVWAEATLPESQADRAGAYGVHPALLDAALHAVTVGSGSLPASFGDVVLRATGATHIRVRLTLIRDDEFSVAIADGGGAPVLSIGSVVLRPLPEGDFATAPRDTAVLALQWTALDAVSSAPADGWVVVGPGGKIADLDALIAAVGDGAPVPRQVVLAVPHHPRPAPDLVHEVTVRTLEQVQRWLGEQRLGGTRLAVVTRSAVTTGADDPVTDLPASAVWGLIRSAQTENPDRITLVDLKPGVPLDLPALAGVALTAEDQVAFRDGEVRVPRLVRRTPAVATAGEPAVVRGTVVITGALGGLGSLTARHLVRHHGVRHLLLASRRGERAQGAAELTEELTELGARVTVVACDVSDRNALARMLAAVPGEHPVSGVVHTAGLLDDGVIESLTGERVSRVLLPKVDAAWHLHELTQGMDLSFFVVFSSLAGLLGGPGQANYAAGNVFADTLVQWRRQAGLPGVSMAWGAWTPEVGLTGTLTDIDLRRMARAGMPLLSVEQGLDLFDQALGADDAVLGLTRLDTGALRAQGDVPPILRSLVGGVVRRVAGNARQRPGGFAQQWSALPAEERPRFLHKLLRGHVAAVLGHRSPDHIDVDEAFKLLGFDSLTAVELRNEVAAATGLGLPATLVFDYPTIALLADHLAVRLAELLGEKPVAAEAVGTPPPVVSVADDPIVIVGMACRFPGNVADPDGLWRLLVDGEDAVAGFPTDRGWDLDELLASGASATARGGFLHGVGDFDAGFFGISPREALAMDPQQRLLLETSWEALEHAGIDPASMAGEAAGVFVGAFPSGYTELASRADGDLAGHLITGGSGSVVSGRVAYTLGLHGPAVTVDTACSSSLVALHLAAQALRSGECTMALTGGVTVIATPDTFVGFSQQGGLSVDGRCKAFADAADGTGWSEGAGMLVVQRLSDARRAGRRVLAVVRSSAVNQDGASNGLTAPNGPAQQRVIRQALAGAGLSAAEVDAVEAHGTGTVLGDPIEAQALIATYGQGRPADRPLWLGSLKSNFGHTQAAAGVAGIIKMVMAMRHGVLPRTLHVDAPSSRVDWTQGSVRLLTEATAWPESGRARRAGVSSFGVSGTNAHVILEAPEPVIGPLEPVEPVGSVGGLADALAVGVVPWVLSGKTAEAVRVQAARLLDRTETDRTLDVREVAWSLAATRSRFDHRTVVIGADRDTLLAGLRAVSEGMPTAQAFHGDARVGSGAGVGVLFSGQGAQRLGMGRRLYECSAVFAGALDVVVAELELHVGRSLTEVMWGGDAGLLEGTGWAQPALFAVEVALFRVVESWGVVVDYVLGHSVGEIAAAYVSGVLSLGDACRLVVARGGLMQALPAGGAMVAVEASEDEVVGLLTAGVSIAAVNSPESLVVAGAEDEVTRIAEEFAGRGRRTNRLRVSHAFHSPLMEPMLHEFELVLRTLTWGAPRIPVVSNLTGELVDAELLCSPAYWVRQVRETVRFADGVRRLESLSVRTLIEVGPNGALAAMAQHTCTDEVAAVALLRGDDQPEDTALAAGAARLFVRGVPMNRYALTPGGSADGDRWVELPTYAFQRERYWVEADETTVSAAGDARDAEFWASVERQDVGALAESLGLDGDVVSPLLPALSSWRDRNRDDRTADSWRYREIWKRLDGFSPAEMTVPWLVVVPAVPTASGADPWVTDVVAAMGPEVHVLEYDGMGRAALAARLPEGDFAGVLSLLATAESGPGVTPPGVVPTLTLLQALGDAGNAAPVWAVTRGAVSVGRHDPVTNPRQAGIWGVARVAALERPQQWGGVVDLPEALDSRTTRRLTSILTGSVRSASASASAEPGVSDEDQLAVRDGEVFGRRLVHAPSSGSVGAPWSVRGTVLITGGTGGLGAFVARWVVERGAEHVLLLSRRGPEAAGAKLLSGELETLGARVTVAACDVTDRSALAAVIDGIPGDVPLTTVVHAAGVSHGVVEIDEVTPDEVEVELRAKVAGATHLDELTRDLDLNAFVLFSSGASAWGSGGQAAYAAGNAYLDALAAHRRAHGRPGTAIAWGNWAEAGMAVDNPEQGAYLRRLGVLPMRPEFALAALSRVLRDDETGMTVTDMDWSRFAPAFTVARKSALLSDIPEVEQALTGAARDSDEEAGSEFTRRWADLASTERPRFLQEFIRGQVAAVLGHTASTRIDIGQAFKELGFDSLTAVELRNQLAAATGLSLPATLAFDYPSITALAGHLTELLGSSSESDDDEALRRAIASIPPAKLREAGLLDLVLGLADSTPGLVGPGGQEKQQPGQPEQHRQEQQRQEDDEAALLAADVDDLVRIALAGNDDS